MNAAMRFASAAGQQPASRSSLPRLTRRTGACEPLAEFRTTGFRLRAVGIVLVNFTEATLPLNMLHGKSKPCTNGNRAAPRCPIAKPECSEKIPELLEVEPGRFVRCPFWKNA